MRRLDPSAVAAAVRKRPLLIGSLRRPKDSRPERCDWTGSWLRIVLSGAERALTLSCSGSQLLASGPRSGCSWSLKANASEKRTYDLNSFIELISFFVRDITSQTGSHQRPLDSAFARPLHCWSPLLSVFAFANGQPGLLCWSCSCAETLSAQARIFQSRVL